MSEEAGRRGMETDSLVHAFRVVRERWWTVALVAVACTLLALAFSITRPDVFTAGSSVLFGQSQLADNAFGIQREAAQPERFAATQVLVASSPEVADRVRRQLGTQDTRDSLVDAVTVQASDNADVLDFEAQAPDAERAAALANGFARGYVEFSRDTEVRQLDANIRALGPQIEAAPEGSPERRDLDQRLSTLVSLKAAADGGAKVIGSASPPTARSSPDPRRDAVLGALLGLVLGLTVVFLLDLFDRRVKSVEDFERLYGLRALAAIPQIAFTPRNQEERSLGFEPYRVLRNALGFVELTHDLDVIMVTSAMPSEGKSSVALNLARAIALSGQRVVLVECDLRKPSLSHHLDMPKAASGLTTALVGRRPVMELLEPVTPGLHHLSLLASGPLPPNAAELLRSPRMGQVLAELKAEGARVVIDAPPLLPVADAQGLLDHPQLDGALIVTRLEHTTREEARRARQVLDQHRLQPLGLVVTGVKEERAYAYYGVGPGDPSAPPAEGSAAAFESRRSPVARG